MQKHYTLLLLVLLLCTLHAIAQDTFITVGSGGGFTGAVTVYKITEKGEVFKGGMGGIFTECGAIRKSKARKFVKETTNVVQRAGDFNHPGNLYHFLSFKNEGQENKITWGSSQEVAPEGVTEVYKKLMDTIASLKFKPIPDHKKQ